MIEKKESVKRSTMPSLPGTYALVLRCSRRLEIPVGRLGTLADAAGLLRVRRQCVRAGRIGGTLGGMPKAKRQLRWHIDYLAAVDRSNEVWYTADKTTGNAGGPRFSKQLPGATVPLAGFGSSDCRCRSHLCYL